MDTITKPEADRVYEDFEPYHEWDKYDGSFTVMLPGYRRDQMKVQVTSKPALRLMGERPTFQNRWRRFKLEFPIPSDYDADSVTASFEGGKLSVKFAKLIKPNETTTAAAAAAATNPPEETPRPNEPSQKGDDKMGAQEGTPKTKEEKVETKETTTNPPEEAPSPKEPSQKVDEQRAGQEGISKAKEEKAETKTNVSDQNTPPQKEKESITKTDAETSKSPETKGLNDWQKLVAWFILILLVMGLGLYCRKAFGSSQVELDTEDLLLDPY
ncbi:unnamed protein product [Trifolium pratense]|uniref:Uncharacterized protein n=1 Tax=Trifolium pratense TaxID=57577 RepID=A0ACB0KA53_TRIPR|nr:unnamed protein product [Trifolium pratense]